MFLSVSHLSIRYPGADHLAVDEVSLGLAAGEIGVLIGPSGCGKTTLLRAVAGLERATSGKIALQGETVSGDGTHVPMSDATGTTTMLVTSSERVGVSDEISSDASI